MNIQTLHPAPGQMAPDQRTAPAVSDAAVNALTGADEAPGITAAEKTPGPGESGIQGELRDRYAPEERGGKAGLYRMTKDEEGNPTVEFDDPRSEEKAPVEEKPAPEHEAPKEEEAKEAKEAKESKTVTNTDRVDRELQQLREQVEDLERQLRLANGEEASKLTDQLNLLKIELRIKDNDTYRRANAQISTV